MTLASYVAKTAPPLADAYYVRLFAPRERRERITAVLAYAAELDECVRDPLEPAVASLKLAWWREEVELLVIGQPRHPITSAVADSSALCAARTAWLALVDAAERSLERAPHASLPALYAHCAEAGALHELLALALDANGATLVHARALGAAVAYARVLGAARRTAATGRIELPLDLLAAQGLQRAELLGEWPSRAVALLAQLGSDARAQLDAARVAITPAERPALQPCMIMAELQAARLARLHSGSYEDARAEVHPLTRLWIAWRTARRCAQTS